ncbi:MAG TPA: hypothetical protein VD927_15025 [Chryseosolibacter sp.]|nr:hypothetical protein [Chryseosolibacter sp.]
MKKLVFAVCMLFGAVGIVNAQDSTSSQSPTDPTSTSQPSEMNQDESSDVAMQEDGRVKIKSQDLPDAVKSSLEGQEYRGWLVNAAYKVESASNASAGSQVEDEETASTSSSDSTSVSGQVGDEENAGEMGAHNQEVYIVELKNGAQTKTVRFDKDGKKLDGGDEMNEDQE